MVKFGKTYQPNAQAKHYAKRIRVAWRSVLDSTLNLAQLLREAQEKLGRKAWLEMVDNDLPFQRRTAEKLVKIASDQRIRNPKHAASLPPRWTTLHELTYLSDKQFEDGVKSGIIHAGMERQDAEKLTARQKRRTAKRTSQTLGTADNGRGGPVMEAAVQPLDMDESDLALDGSAVAVLKPCSDIDDATAADIEYELRRISSKYGLKLYFRVYSSAKVAQQLRRKNLARELEDWHREHAKIFNKHRHMSDDEIRQVDAALYQMETGKPLHRRNGSYHPDDLRNPANPFHDWKDEYGNWDLERLYDYCEQHLILTRYTPLQWLRYDAYLWLLVWQHCVSDAARRREIEATLLELDRKEHQIAEASRAADEAQARGEPLDAVVKLIPAAQSTYRSMEIDKFSDITPGHARTAYELLIR